jgi:hypothetical protein
MFRLSPIFYLNLAKFLIELDVPLVTIWDGNLWVRKRYRCWIYLAWPWVPLWTLTASIIVKVLYFVSMKILVVFMFFLDTGTAAQKLILTPFLQTNHIEHFSIMVSSSLAGQILSLRSLLHFTTIILQSDTILIIFVFKSVSWIYSLHYHGGSENDVNFNW